MNTKRICSGLLIAVAISAVVRTAEAAEFRYPPTISPVGVRRWINKASTEHPRLLVTQAELVRLRQSWPRPATVWPTKARSTSPWSRRTRTERYK